MPVLLATALIGAAIGGGVSYAFQVSDNLRSGQELAEALVNVDVAKVAGDAVGGAVSGFLMGAAAPVGLAAALGTGAVSGLVGGRYSALGEAATNQMADVIQGSQWDHTEFRENAIDAGVVDVESMVYDAAGGAVSAGAAHYLASGSSFLSRFGDQTIGDDFSGHVILPAQNSWEAAVMPAVSGAYSFGSEVVSESAGTGTGRVIDRWRYEYDRWWETR